MVNFTSILALLCTFSWISVSVSQFNTVEVQSGEEVTLLCTNFSHVPIHIYWFRLANEPNVSCISFMLFSDSDGSPCDGFQNGKFTMKSNITDLFLKITPVDSSDSGLYFCGEYNDGQSVIKSATYLKVQGNPPATNSRGGTMAAAIFFFIIAVTGATLKICKCQRADNQEPDPRHSENLDLDDKKDVGQTLKPKTVRNRRPASEREVETCVIYSSSRK